MSNSTAAWIDRQLLRDFESEKTTAHRLCTVPDGWVERFGSDILISFKTDETRERLVAEFFIWSEALGFPVKRIFGRPLPRQNAKREAPKQLLGEKSADRGGIVLERHLHYGVDFSAGYSAGLFLDQRENRSCVRQAGPKRLLNCFAYTCSFSVAAAIAGAQTVSVDISGKSLARGRANFALNDVPLPGHSFICDDVLAVLPRLARRGEKFDMIILDPPTFSRARSGKAFQVQNDLEDLILLALNVTQRDTRILLSTNCHRLDERALEVVARFCLKTARRAGKFHRVPAPVEFPSGTAASTIWLALR